MTIFPALRVIATTLAAALVVGAILYVTSLKSERDAALSDVTTLLSVAKAQNATISDLVDDRERKDEIILKWKGDYEKNNANFEKMLKATRRAMQDQGFAGWATTPYPAAILSSGLLQGGCHDSTPDGSTVSTGSLDDAHAMP